MKTILTMLVVLFMIPNLSVAEPRQQAVLNAPLKLLQVMPPHQNNSCQHFSHTLFAKRGCCSRHKGVCGCTHDGRTKCCDATISPSCTCNAVTDQAVGL